MNQRSALDTLVALFQEAAALNREALQGLRQGLAAADLEAIFTRKMALGAELQALQAGMDKLDPTSGQDALQAAFQAQREAATTESQLAEMLGNIVPQSGKAASAYDRFRVEKQGPKLDSSI